MTPTPSNGGKRGGQPRRNGQGTPEGKKTRPKNPAWKYPDRLGSSQPEQRKRRQPRPPSLTFGQALLIELQEIFHSAWYHIYENGENILKGMICGLYLVFLLLLQTTFFVRFAPFGAIPDLLLSLTVAVAVSEGEKWGAVFGLAAAYLSQALGGTSAGPFLLPLLYMPAGYFCGICAKYYLSDSIPVRGIYIAACGAGKAVITMISAVSILNATPGEIFAGIVLPEFFSTAVMAPAIYGLVYLSLKPFHKSRAQRTGD